MKKDEDLIEFSRHLLEDQLLYITTYLGERFPSEFFLTDASSTNHLFWIAEGSCLLLEGTEGSPQPKDKVSEKCYYDKDSRLFSYLIDFAGISFYISARPVHRKQVTPVREAIERLEPAIKKYLDLYSLAQRNVSIYDSPLQTHFFYNKTFDKAMFLKFTKQSLSDDKLYCVCIKDFDPDNPISPQKLLSLGERTRIRRSEQLFNFIYGNRSLMVYACCQANMYDPSKDYAVSVRHAHAEVTQLSKISYTVNTGVGSPHPPDRLFESYKEAFFSLAIGTLRNQKNFVLSFKELGEFSLMLDHDVEKIIAHSEAFLAPLISKPDGQEQLDTLRNLINNEMHYKGTAAQMYIHPNTLHYRINKSLAILGLDLTKTQDLAQLYAEIRIYDVLKFCDFMQ